MPRAKKETHLFFEQGDDEIQIRSWDKNLNAAIRKMKAAHPETVWIRENDDDEPGFLWGAVKLENITFKTLPPTSGKSRTAHSEKIGRSTAYEIVKNGRIKTVKIGKRYIIPKQSVIEFLNTAS